MIRSSKRFAWVFIVLAVIVVGEYSVGNAIPQTKSSGKVANKRQRRNLIMNSKVIHPGLSLRDAKPVKLSELAGSCPAPKSGKFRSSSRSQSQFTRLHKRSSQADRIASQLPPQFRLTMPSDPNVDYTNCYQLVGYHGTCTRRNADSIERAITPQPLRRGNRLQLGEGFYITPNPFDGYSFAEKSCDDNRLSNEPALCAVYIERESFKSLSKLFVPRATNPNNPHKTKTLWWSNPDLAEWHRKHGTSPRNTILFSRVDVGMHDLNLPSDDFISFQGKIPNEILSQDRVMAKCVMQNSIELDEDEYTLDWPNLFPEWGTKVWGGQPPPPERIHTVTIEEI
ncbi:hypothetical protein BKA69DRAFT_1062268 [Paraphysoderma sedebokerense]|nr:hypothetical protein BKA69DRAFT_1062268 [Paraphysoderma sedebokerense]